MYFIVYNKLGYQVMRGAVLSDSLPLIIQLVVGNYAVGIPYSPHGSISVSRPYRNHMFSTWWSEHILIGQIRYLFFRFGKKIRMCSSGVSSIWYPCRVPRCVSGACCCEESF